jgi:large subunit ribosomal protein L4e
MKRHAAASALAASALPALVIAKGHKISRVNELPLVIKDDFQKIDNTKNFLAMIKKLHLDEDLQHVKDSKHIRPGKGKSRNRKYKMSRGPLFIYASDDGFRRTTINVPGIDTCNIDYLNILSLAPGGNLGRMIVWSESAFKKLKSLFGTYHNGAGLKKGYHLPRAVMTNADLGRIINSDEIQSVVNPAKETPLVTRRTGNPLKNKALMAKLNPGSTQKRKLRQLQATEGTEQRKALLAEKKARDDAKKAHKKENKNKFYKEMLSYYVKEEEPAAEEEE